MVVGSPHLVEGLQLRRVKHYAALRRSVEEHAQVEIAPLHAHTETILDSRLVAVGREHHTVFAAYLAVTVDIAVLYIARHHRGPEKALVGMVVDVGLVFE